MKLDVRHANKLLSWNLNLVVPCTITIRVNLFYSILFYSTLLCSILKWGILLIFKMKLQKRSYYGLSHFTSPVHGTRQQVFNFSNWKNIVIVHNLFYGYLQGLFNILYYGIMENLPIATIPLVMGTLLLIISTGCFEILGVLTAALKTTDAMWTHWRYWSPEVAKVLTFWT